MLIPVSATKFTAPVVGFNHNLKHAGRVFHVQTEDSGLPRAHYLTHLFIGGNIVASMKGDYSDKADEPELQQIVRKLMEEQHKQMVRRLVAGEFTELAARFSPHYEPGVLASGHTGPAAVNVAGAAPAEASALAGAEDRPLDAAGPAPPGRVGCACSGASALREPARAAAATDPLAATAAAPSVPRVAHLLVGEGLDSNRRSKPPPPPRAPRCPRRRALPLLALRLRSPPLPARTARLSRRHTPRLHRPHTRRKPPPRARPLHARFPPRTPHRRRPPTRPRSRRRLRRDLHRRRRGERTSRPAPSPPRRACRAPLRPPA